MALARDQLLRASDRLRDARTASTEHRLADATRYCQESLELALRATLRSLSVEVPKRHDVAPELGRVAPALPPWFVRELPTLKQLSFELSEGRSLAMYGDERTGRPASELFDDPVEVDRYLKKVDHAVALARRLLRSAPRARYATRRGSR
jgi:HEPN domain-containing protein